MPLRPGEPVGTAIKELYNHGSRPRSRDQIIAIAESNHRHHLGTGGLPMAAPMMGHHIPSIHAPGVRPMPLGAPAIGGIAKSPGHIGLAQGGYSPPPAPFYERNEARQMQNDTYHPGGLLMSDAAGRTDRLPHAVAADSFVMPADVVAGIGQNNTLSGAKIMDGILSSGPFGTSLPKITHGRGPGEKFADGGYTKNDAGISHVMLAGGEYLVPRDKLIEMGRRMRAAKKSRAKTDLAAGHEWARDFVKMVRQKQMDFLKHAPDPKR